MPRKITKFIEPIHDTFENVARCMVKNIDTTEDTESEMSEMHGMAEKPAIS